MRAFGQMRHADVMDKPRRRAAGRPAGPPNIVSDPVATEPPAAEPVIADPIGPTDQTGQQHRRRQRHARQPNDEEPSRTSSAGGAAQTTPEPARVQHQRPSSGQSTGRDDRRRGESSVERSLRALVSTRTTQLSPTVAMRAREVATPTRADLAAAEEELVIVRRHYIPPAPLATAGKVTEQRPPEKRPADSRVRAPEGKRGARRS